jgi:hypothetical protein
MHGLAVHPAPPSKLTRMVRAARISPASPSLPDRCAACKLALINIEFGLMREPEPPHLWGLLWDVL